MNFRIEKLNSKKLIGMKASMSFAKFNVASLWQKFMQRRNEITNTVSTELISMTIYSPTHFTNFSTANNFEKWAAVEVIDYKNIPQGMESFTLANGEYAVFLIRGDATEFRKQMQYIYSTWLPATNYVLANKPHFELLGSKYKNNHPDSEEEVWIPILPK
jgi:AraC family transcriptional regulator